MESKINNNMKSINDQLERKKEVFNTRDNINDTIRVVGEIIDIYKESGQSQKAVNLQVLLTQLELQNEALINRMKGVIND